MQTQKIVYLLRHSDETSLDMERRGVKKFDDNLYYQNQNHNLMFNMKDLYLKIRNILDEMKA